MYTIQGQYLSPKNIEYFITKANNIDEPAPSAIYNSGTVNDISKESREETAIEQLAKAFETILNKQNRVDVNTDYGKQNNQDIYNLTQKINVLNNTIQDQSIRTKEYIQEENKELILDINTKLEKKPSNVPFPPPLNGFKTVVSGNTYVVEASTNRADYLVGWGVFNGIPPTGNSYANNKWQSADGRYDENTFIAKSNPGFNGFTPTDYTGEWISLTVSNPMYLNGYTVAGSLVDWRLYASPDPTNPGLWEVVDQRENHSGVYTQEQTFIVHHTQKAYKAFVIKISKSKPCAGWGRGCMAKLQFYGYQSLI